MSNANLSAVGRAVRVAPVDAQWEYGGLYYKTGSHNFLYMWLDTHWLRSSANKRLVCTKKIV
jgi:hypothetical protein